VVDGSLTLLLLLAEVTKAEENGTNGQDETAQEEKKPNAFDKIQADENDEGKTSAKVRLHDVQSYHFSIANASRHRLRTTTASPQMTQRTTPMAMRQPTPLQKKPWKKTPPAPKPNPPTSSKKA
jgi:hypothetical protein